jgi:hypothetical protein
MSSVIKELANEFTKLLAVILAVKGIRALMHGWVTGL